MIRSQTSITSTIQIGVSPERILPQTSRSYNRSPSAPSLPAPPPSVSPPKVCNRLMFTWLNSFGEGEAVFQILFDALTPEFYVQSSLPALGLRMKAGLSATQR